MQWRLKSPASRWRLKSPASTVYSVADKKNHQSSASLAFVRGIHLWPVNSRHKGPVTRKMFPFHDVIMRFSDWLIDECDGSIYPLRPHIICTYFMEKFFYRFICWDGITLWTLSMERTFGYTHIYYWPRVGTFLFWTLIGNCWKAVGTFLWTLRIVRTFC